MPSGGSVNEAFAIDRAAATMPRPMRCAFATWTLCDDARFAESARRELDASSLDEAVKQATPPPMPVALARGGFPAFVILETDETAREGSARHTLHFYTVKVKREWRSTRPLWSQQQVAVPYAVHSGSLAMAAFDPRRPFDAALDCPGNGRQPGEARLIEARA